MASGFDRAGKYPTEDDSGKPGGSKQEQKSAVDYVRPPAGRGRGRGRGLQPRNEDPYIPRPGPTSASSVCSVAASSTAVPSSSGRRTVGSESQSMLSETMSSVSLEESSTLVSGASAPSPASVALAVARTTSESRKMTRPDKRELARRPPEEEQDRRREIRLRSNHYEIKVGDVVEVYVFRVFGFRKLRQPQDNANPLSPLKVELSAKLFWKSLEQETVRDLGQNPVIKDRNLRRIAFDGGHILYCLDDLLCVKKIYNDEVKLSLEGERQDPYVVQYNRVSVQPLEISTRDAYKMVMFQGSESDREGVNAAAMLEAVLCQKFVSPFVALDNTHWFRTGRAAFYSEKAKTDYIGEGKILCHGFCLSAGSGPDGNVFINFDRSDSPSLFSGTGPADFYRFLCEVLKKENIDEKTEINDAMSIQILSNHLKNVDIETEHTGKKMSYKVMKVRRENGRQMEFPMKEVDRSGTVRGFRKVTVFDYFKARYGEELKFPLLPLLECGRKNKPVFIPMELCKILPGQKYSKGLSDNCTREVIKNLCTPAPRRQARIGELWKEVQLGKDHVSQEFGVSLQSNEMMCCTGRILTPPVICYANREVTPREGEGSWRTGPARDAPRGQAAGPVRLYHTNPVNNFLVIALRPPPGFERQAGDFCRRLQRTAEDMGLRWFTYEPMDVHRVSDPARIGECIRKSMANYPDVNLILIMMGGRDTAAYSAVKRNGDTAVGVATQCLLYKTVGINTNRPVDTTTLHNILFKINVKLGGTNCILKNDRTRLGLVIEGTMILGIDISHPRPGQSGGVSVAAVVGSVDNQAVRYSASVHALKTGRETMDYILKQPVEELINNYTHHNRAPERLIIYRDGVSDTQYDQIMREEMEAIDLACDSVHKGWRPSINVILVVKRHHVRFFCQDRKDESGKSQNVPPGTLVTTTIVRPSEFDFYMVSHFGIQGTSRPTHYVVLRNDSGFSSRDIEHLTWELCHVYARCPRSVSIPAPVYYADLAAERARYHMFETAGEETPPSWERESSSGRQQASSSSDPDSSSLQLCCSVHEKLKNTTMYFC